MDIISALIHDRQYQGKRYIRAIPRRVGMLGPGCQGEEAKLCPVGTKKSAHVLLSVALFCFVEDHCNSINAYYFKNSKH